MRMTEEEYRELLRRRGAPHPSPAEAGDTFPSRGRLLGDGETGKSAKRSKYGNTRVEIDGKKFDSIHEAQVYDELMGMWMAGQLQVVMRQVPFDLPGGIRYVADFCTVDKDGRFEVLDAKSAITKRNRVYINKKKQMAAIWGLEIREV